MNRQWKVNKKWAEGDLPVAGPYYVTGDLGGVVAEGMQKAMADEVVHAVNTLDEAKAVLRELYGAVAVQSSLLPEAMDKAKAVLAKLEQDDVHA